MLYVVPAASQMLSAAPVPRPPQPIRPTLMVSLPLAWALGRKPSPPAAAAAAVVVALRKSRRLGEEWEPVMASISWKEDRTLTSQVMLTSTCRLAFDHQGLESLEVLLLVQRADETETDESGVSVPPD